MMTKRREETRECKGMVEAKKINSSVKDGRKDKSRAKINPTLSEL